MFESTMVVTYEIYKNEKYLARGTALVHSKNKLLVDAKEISNGKYVFRYDNIDYNVEIRSGRIISCKKVD